MFWPIRLNTILLKSASYELVIICESHCDAWHDTGDWAQKVTRKVFAEVAKNEPRAKQVFFYLLQPQDSPPSGHYKKCTCTAMETTFMAPARMLLKCGYWDWPPASWSHITVAAGGPEALNSG